MADNRQNSSNDLPEDTLEDTLDGFQYSADLLVEEVEAAAVEHYQNNRLERAEELVQILVKMRPENVDYWALLGVIYRREGKKAAALTTLRRAVEVDHDDKNALVNLGETLLEVGKVREGVGLLRAVFDASYDPDKTTADQDYFAKRTGAQLALVQRLIRGFVEDKRLERGAAGA